MDKRALPDRQREWLSEELSHWRERGLISPEQAVGIFDLYESRDVIIERRRSRAIFVLMSAAALLCALSLLMIVGYNWEEMPRIAKLVVIFGVILGTYAGAFSLRYRVGARGLSEAVFFLGCLFYGVGIWLIAQIFHLDSHYPNGVWIWAIGVLPFALCLDTLLLHGLLAALLALWAGMEVLGFSHLGGWLFGRWPSLPNAAYTLPLLALPGLVWAYRKNSPATVGLYAALLTWWGILQPYAWRWSVNDYFMVGFVGNIAALLLIAAESHREGSSFITPYRVFGGLLAAGLLIPLSFYDFHRELHPMATDRFAPEMLAAALALPALVVVAAIVFREFRRCQGGKPRPLVDEWPNLVRRFWFPGTLLAVMTFISLSGGLMVVPGHGGVAAPRLGSIALVSTILANATTIALAYWLLQIGLREDRGLFFTAGVLYFLLWAILRYIDLFGDFGGMLGAALMFFLCAGALFGVALYWHHRHEVRHV
jgi:hypothetical protein